MAEAPSEIEQGSSKKRLATTALSSALGIVLLGLALWFLRRELAELTVAQVVMEMRSIPWSALLTAAACAACGYTVLTGYDAAALRYVGKKLRYREIGQTSFMAFAVAHNVGVATLSGGAVRYRMYSLLGLTAYDIAQVALFCTVTFSLGASLLLSASLLLMPAEQLAVLNLPPLLVSSLGVILLLIPLAYLGLTILHRAPFQVLGWQLPVPRSSLAVVQIGLSVADLVLAGATLYVLIAPQLPIGFVPFIGFYLIALAAGLLSNLPGGVGVFEAVIVAAFPQVELAPLLGAIIVYRLIYYVIPFVIAVALLGRYEIERSRQMFDLAAGAVGGLSTLVPPIIAAVVFLGGTVLLISGAAPAVEERLELIARLIPLPVLELSHLLGSILGAGLLVLARGLVERLHSAYVVTFGVLIAGAVSALLKGLDYEEATILLFIAVFLWICRSEFHRRGSFATQPFSLGWYAAVILVLISTVWIAVVSYREVAYSSELWWQFALDADAPRTLRATLVVAIAFASFAAWRLLRAGAGLADVEEAANLDEVRAVLAGAASPSANLALLGDKRFLWSSNRAAFIMYRVSGDSWVAMGDPVGPAENNEELVWTYRELVDRHGGRPVFYQISHTALPLYVDAGLTVAKLGEDARVRLGSFSLDGSQYARFRQAISRGKRDGASFAIVPSADVPMHLAELRSVSDAWLEAKHVAEKSFSLGAFSDAYIAEFDCAVVRFAGSIVAFANLWRAAPGTEISVDMVRYDARAPKGVMDYLYAELMVWAKEQGYEWFDLGMAPLSGLESHELAPLWHRIGHLIFSHGEAFYNFEGVRDYKKKFSPEWVPRYVATPGGMAVLPMALLDVARLISGGWTGLVRK